MTRELPLRPLTFGDALVAGEIAVGGYVREATRHKRGTQRSALGCAVFQEQPAAGGEMPGGAINKSGERAQAIVTRRQRAAWLVPQTIALQHRVIRRDVGRVAGEGV